MTCSTPTIRESPSRLLPLERKRDLIEAMVTVTIMPIGHGGAKVFDPLMVEILAHIGVICRL